MKKYYFIVLSIMLFIVNTYSQVVVDTTKTFKLNEVEITGTRPGLNTPISQKIISNLDIDKNYHGQELVYNIDNTPSITSQSDGGQPNGYVSFRLRGIDQTRINMTLNGVPLNEPEDEGVYFSNYPNFIMNINSMQIQRGVGSSSNGTASYGGSINFESKNGTEKGFNIGTTFGSFNTKSTNISYGSGLLNNKLSLYGSTSIYSSDGYKYNSSGQGYSGFFSGSYFTKNNILKLTMFSGLSINEMAWYAVSEVDIKKDPRTSYNRKGENDRFRQSLIQIQDILVLNEKSVLTNTVYYNRLDGNYGTFISDVDLYDICLGSDFYGLISNYRYKLNNFTFNTGLHINSYIRNHIGTISNEETYTNTGNKNERTVYAKTEYCLGNFIIYGDIQSRNILFEYKGDVKMEDKNWNFVNPRGGLLYNINKTSNFYFSVGKTHREPTRSDMFGGNDNLVTLGIIKPESVIDYEIGLNLKTNRVKLQTNLYFMDFKDEITLLGAVGLNSLPLMTSVDRSYRSGLEFDVTYKLSKHFNLNNNTVLSRNKITGDEKQYSPLLTPNFILNQEIEYIDNGFTLSVMGKYVSKSYINSSNTESIPNHLVFNSKIGYKYKNLNLSVQCINLFNKQYYTGGYVYDSVNCFYIGSPSSVYYTLNYRF